MLSNGGVVRGHVKIGLIASIPEGALIDTLSDFSNKYPEVEVTVSDGYTSTLTDWITGGHLDAAIVNKPRRPLALDLEHIVDEEMVLITGTHFEANLPQNLSLRQLPSLGLPLSRCTASWPAGRCAPTPSCRRGWCAASWAE